MKQTRVDRRLPNYIRIHRRRAGLSQRELGEVLGCTGEQAVSRHEQFLLTPSMQRAIGYEIVFRIPISEIFAGLHDDVSEEVERRLSQLEETLGHRSARDRNATATARKLLWLAERRSQEQGPSA